MSFSSTSHNVLLFKFVWNSYFYISELLYKFNHKAQVTDVCINIEYE